MYLRGHYYSKIVHSYYSCLLPIPVNLKTVFSYNNYQSDFFDNFENLTVLIKQYLHSFSKKVRDK